MGSTSGSEVGEGEGLYVGSVSGSSVGAGSGSDMGAGEGSAVGSDTGIGVGFGWAGDGDGEMGDRPVSVGTSGIRSGEDRSTQLGLDASVEARSRTCALHPSVLDIPLPSPTLSPSI